MEVKTKVCSKCGEEKSRTREYFTVAKKHSDGLTSECKDCSKAWHKNDYATRKERRDYHSEYSNEWANKRKMEVFNHYGDGVVTCSCLGCNERNVEFLSIDHINGGGHKHRESIGIKGGYHFYKWLIDNGFPEGYRILCHNCNQCTGYYGYCPHERPDLAGSMRKVRQSL